MFYPFFNYLLATPLFVPTDNRPPSIYDILNAMANFDKLENEQIKVSQLAEQMHSRIFDFNYPLSKNVSRATFETMLLNKFLMRRIGFETFTAFLTSFTHFTMTWSSSTNDWIVDILPLYLPVIIMTGSHVFNFFIIIIR